MGTMVIGGPTTTATIQAATNETLPEDDEALREAQIAEKAAEGLALEAQRTWSDAQRLEQYPWPAAPSAATTAEATT